MMPRVEVRTHCRLHFGLTTLGHDANRPQFGGIGAMVAAPGIDLRITPSDAFHVVGPLQDRVASFVSLVVEHWRLPSPPDVTIEVIAAPREHVGLGVGTQLGLSVAAGLGEALGLPWRDPLRLAQLTRRGRRSAVGTYGFLLGGLIVDSGHRGDESLGRLAHRCELPANWRFVLLLPTSGVGRAGAAEERAFSQLPPVPAEVTLQLEEMAADLVLAAARGSFPEFSDALFRYGRLAGTCFATVQGGAFCSAQTAELIAWLRRQSVAGVGQSSWGPTVFALLPDQRSAEQVASALTAYSNRADYEVLIAPPANQGVTVTKHGGALSNA